MQSDQVYNLKKIDLIKFVLLDNQLVQVQAATLLISLANAVATQYFRYIWSKLIHSGLIA